MMPTMTDRTPQQWAVFCAEKVMGEDWLMEFDRSGRGKTVPWSPYDNPADALEVLERLQLKLQTPNGNMPDIYLRQFWSDEGQVWGVQIGDEGERVCISGDHYGPAVCRLAEKVMDGR